MLVASFAIFIIADVLVGLLGTQTHHTLANVLTGLIGAVSAGALGAGTVSVATRRERSIVVFAAMALALYQLFSAVVALLGLPE